MKTITLPFTALLVGAQVNAQITAGQEPAGQSAYDVLGAVALTTSFTSDSIGLELDCDDALDGWAILRRGYPGIDAPHYAELRFYDADMEVCMDTASGFQQRPRYYTFGQPLDCSGSFNWQDSVQHFIGDLGGWVPVGPEVVDSLYIAYRQAGVIGWILLSFDLTDDAEIDMEVHRILSICGGSNSITQHAPPMPVILYPNPSAGQTVHVESTNAIQGVEVLDLSGRIIGGNAGTGSTIAAPHAAGTYLVRVIHADGRVAVLPLVRY